MFAKTFDFLFPFVFSVCFMLIGGLTLFSGCIKGQSVEKGQILNEIAAVKQTAEDVKTGLVQTNKDIKTYTEKVENFTQTNNTGTFSGGAPYLVSVVAGFFWYLNRKEKNDTKERLAEQKLLNDAFIEALKGSGKTDAEIQEVVTFIKNSNEKEIS